MQKIDADIGGVAPSVATNIYQVMAVSADAAWGGKLFEPLTLLDFLKRNDHVH
jgi:hypothetical protein